MGRDGVGAGSARGIYVCSSLRDDVDSKALADIQRLISTTKNPTKIYFCSSHPISEHRINKIIEALSREIDDVCEILCIGCIQIAEIGIRKPSPIHKLYGAEIRDCYRTIKADPDDDADIKGLRLALLAATGDDSLVIRREVYQIAITDVLIDRVKRTAATLCLHLSENLRLATRIAIEAVNPHLETLIDQKVISLDNGLYCITEEGFRDREEKEAKATTRLLVGRTMIRDELQKSIGGQISDQHFDRIWTIFESKISQYFTQKGELLVSEISALTEPASALEVPERDAAKATTPLSFLGDLAEAVAGTSSNEDQRVELDTAVRDLFVDRSGPAAEWLVRLSAAYIAACALGLEHTCSGAISRLLSRTELVLDTDVALSTICEGEPESAGANAIVSKWVKNGGSVFVSAQVLEEVAYHASIAQRDFDEVRNLLPGSEADRLHLISNAFVRTFAGLVAKSQASIGHWSGFISQFRGVDNRDSTRVFGYLNSEYSIKMLPPRSTEEAALERSVRAYLIETAEADGNSGFNAQDKATRDAQLYAAIVRRVKLLRSQQPGATCLLVSSSRRLQKADRKFGQTGEVHLVVTMATMLHLLSLLPNVSLGLSAMKAFLFDDRRTRFSSELERTLLRVVKSSREVMLPYAKRGLLMRSVRDGLIADGKPKTPLNTLERDSLKPDKISRTIEILGQSLDKVVVTTKTEMELALANKRIEELEARLARR